VRWFVFSLLALAACAPTQGEEEVELTYYYLQYCRVCDNTRALVNKLPEEFHGHVKVRTVQSLAPEAKEAVANLKWNSHGLVITRGRKVVYSAADHRANGYDAHVALRQMMDLPLDCR